MGGSDGDYAVVKECFTRIPLRGIDLIGDYAGPGEPFLLDADSLFLSVADDHDWTHGVQTLNLVRTVDASFSGDARRDA
eukprot:tig00020556_g10975.t1